MSSPTLLAPGVRGLSTRSWLGPAAGLILAAAVCGMAVPAGADNSPPRLYVIVTVDQMRNDYLDRYGHMWTKGLRRLLDGGARFTQSAYPYMNTVTCAGHATIGTGTFPATHGMVLNQWFDRAEQHVVQCTDDATAPTVHVNGDAATAATGNSGRRLLVPTFADELRAQSAIAPRIVSLSLKPRSAIGMVGHRGDVMLWWDADHGWTTSQALVAEVPAWLAEYARTHTPDAEYGRPWTRLLPEDSYHWDDDVDSEGSPHGWTHQFPHEVTSKSGVADKEFRTKWSYTPAADAALTGLAEAAIDHLQLGRDAQRRDVLAISYSVLDHVGHAYGPRSHEVQDVLARLDATIGDLLDHLDRTVGRQNYVLAFTGDHGVSPIPEQMAALGVDAGRILTQQVRERVDKALEPLFGPGPHVASFAYPDVYFVAGRYESLLRNTEALRTTIQILESVPGVARVYRSDQVAAGTGEGDAAARALGLSFHPARRGDLVLAPRAYWITTGSVATHGSLFDYDARVPLVFFGAGVKAARYGMAASPADIAPTFAHLAGITLPRPDGHVRLEAFDAGAPAATSPRGPGQQTNSGAQTR